MEKVKIIQVGLGPIGQEIVKYTVERKGIEIVAAVDPAADKVGRNLGELCSLDEKLGVKVSPTIDSAVEGSKPTVAILTTVSRLEEIIPQVEEIAGYGMNVVSTCEELAFPWTRKPELAKRLDEIGRKHNVSILGTGVNPGFLMDFLPLVMSGVCREVKSIKVSRIQDASSRRIPFQKKIGAGLTREEFEEKRKAGTLCHVGLTESMQMIAATMNWHLEKTEDILSPVIADSEITGGYRKIGPGMAAGVQQIGRGYLQGKELITLEFRAAVGERNPHDTIKIKGTPEITSTIKGGLNGDVATCAVTLNAVKSIIPAAPGLRTMADIPVVSFFKSLAQE